ncbi:uncharacterized protein LOC126673204 [Mercurialis annua]|uniref:uncharacterized protein LOC126673204 n=1 Tax=Mercurialis annua TaxID=3986 RepID=UPI00215E9BD4|nr:uncharacterized protein LOC126673204 [Mercurialis annua]
MPIPHEIIVEILLRLPLDSLMQLRSVCKAWHLMITKDPQFIQHCAEHQLRWFEHLYERLSHFGLPEHVPKFKKNLHLCMCQQGQAATHLLSTPGTDVNAQLERALEYTGMFTLHAELKDRISYERWMAAVSNFEIPNDSPEIQQRPPRVLEYVKNGIQTDVYEYDEVYGKLVHYGLAVFINELKHRISFRTNYLETHPQWAGVVESSPISTLEVLRYNGLHELLKYLELHIAFNNACGRRDVPIQPHI